MNKYCLPCFAILLFFGCSRKKLDFYFFSIEVPNSWNKEFPYHPIDSHAGVIKAPNFSLDFDCSEQGFASSLMYTEEQYLDRRRINLIISPEQPPDTDATPTSVPLDEIPGALRFEKKDTSVQILKPTGDQKIKYPKSDYIASVKVNGKIAYVPMIIPDLIKKHNIVIDTTVDYIIKTIWPKISGHGMTGIYIRSLKSSFNFQMNAKDLSAKDEADVLKAFKTITFKK